MIIDTTCRKKNCVFANTIWCQSAVVAICVKHLKTVRKSISKRFLASRWILHCKHKLLYLKFILITFCHNKQMLVGLMFIRHLTILALIRLDVLLRGK